LNFLFFFLIFHKIDVLKALNIDVVNKNLREDEILSQSWLFLLAGYETTSTALTFCLYELALHPEVQDILFDELNSSMDSKEEFSYEIVAKLPFLNAVISETLRLYPPFLRLEREVSQEYELGKTGITLFEGQLIQISIYAVQHSEEFFPKPEEFMPQRFMPENREKIIPYSYIPFAVGPRNCIAMRFALMEMKVCIARIVTNFKLRKSPKTDVPLKFCTSTHMCKSDNVIVSIQKRR
jgi:cytochrome P450